MSHAELIEWCDLQRKRCLKEAASQTDWAADCNDRVMRPRKTPGGVMICQCCNERAADIGPWCIRCCPSWRRAVVARVGLAPAPVMPAPGAYAARLVGASSITQPPPRAATMEAA